MDNVNICMHKDLIVKELSNINSAETQVPQQYFVNFIEPNQCIKARRFTQKDPKGPKRNTKGPKGTQKEPKRTQKEPKRKSKWFQTNIKHKYLASNII